MEWLGRFLVRPDVTLDGLFEISDRFEDPRRIFQLVTVEKTPSTALSHDVDVGVKWNVHRG